MADDEKNLATEVSEFLHKSYQCRPNQALVTYFHGISYPTNHPIDGVKCRALPVVTGSRAEFYIETMLKCFGDLDIMYHYSNELAIPEGQRPPTQLPTEFDSRVKVFEIVDSHVPGYVHLHLKYVLSKRKTDNKYTVAEYVNRPNTVLSHELYVIAGVRKYSEKHGPSVCMSVGLECFGLSDGKHRLTKDTADTVPCIRCLAWPLQADDWPTRHRNYGWPDSETIERVVRNGCDVVGVAHSLCKYDEWMSKHQWRLSFSRAEVVLLNSWTPTQQFVYHMLRIFMKTERLFNGANNSDTAGKSALSNYHIKTMMLWACELKPPHWWTDRSNLINLFAQCLYFLDELISKKRGQHYFIKNVHFTDYIDTLSLDTMSSVIKSITEACLTEWFVDNYMRKCAELCPANLPILCSDMVTKDIVGLHDAAAAILRSRKHMLSMDRMFSLFLLACLPEFRSWMRVNWIDGLFNSVKAFKVFFSDFPYGEPGPFQFDMNFYFNLLSCDDAKECPLSNAFLDFMAFMIHKRGGLHFQYDPSTESISLVQLNKAIVWMKIVAEKHPDHHQVVQVNLAKEYLVSVLRCADSDSDSSYSLTNVYMAVLCYITGQYQNATDHCSLVTKSQTYQRCRSQVMDAEILPKIGDDIDSVLGLAVFYQYVRTTTLRHGQSTQHVNVFTTELFAHYFNIRHLLVAKCCLAPKAQVKHALRAVKFHLGEELELFFNRIRSAPSLFVTDCMLVKFSSSSTPEQLNSITNIASDSCSRRQLVELLTRMPIQQMLKYRQFMFRQDVDPQFVAAVKTSDFTALRLYRCRLYERCAQLCQRAVYEMLAGQVCPIARLCFLYREFVQLMDDDVVSLIGMTVLVDKTGIQPKLSLKELVNISELAMSLYLLTRCQMKIQSSKWTPDISPLADVLDLIADAEKLVRTSDVLDHLILKLAERFAAIYVTERINPSD